MAKKAKQKTDTGEKDQGFYYATKRCPECYAYMPLQANRCPECKTRVGGIELHGMAKRTTNWSSYLIALVAIAAFCIYFWWAFLE